MRSVSLRRWEQINCLELQDIHDVRGDGVGLLTAGTGGATIRQRCEESKKWAEWAPGLKKALAVALSRRLKMFNELVPGGEIRKLKPLTAAQWRSHFLHDHQPARRDCSHCVQAQARSRPHRRVQHPESFTLSVDLTG